MSDENELVQDVEQYLAGHAAGKQEAEIALQNGAEPHPCERPGCTNPVLYDDEPYCFVDSPDSGSYQQGYSYKARH